MAQEDIKYDSKHDIEFKEMWKLKDKLNEEKEIKKVPRAEIEEKARGI